MDLLKHTIKWVNGEVLHGSIGLGIGILIAIAFLYSANFQQSFYKGMILPFVLVQFLLLGYGSFQILMRPKHSAKVEQSLSENPQMALKAELKKSLKDDSVYSKIRFFWAVLFVLSVILFFALANDFFKGMSLGFAVFFIVAYTFDTLLHLRLKTYLSALQNIN
jgi:hypothetical protein